MQNLFEPFKRLVNWISSKMEKNGVQPTIIAIMLAIIIIWAVFNQTDYIIRGVGEEMENSKIEQFEEHQDLWVESRELYGKLKTVLKGERSHTGADYILFIEYHNGSENIATGYQFCKFDVSMSVRSDSMPVMDLEDYRDENMWKWDVLLNDKLIHQKISTFSITELQNIDADICNKFRPNSDVEYVVFYNVIHNNVCAGTLMFVYKSLDLIDYGAVASCGTNMENIINSAMKDRKNDEYKRKSNKK